MKPGNDSARALKKKILSILKADELSGALSELASINAKRVVNALFSFLFSIDEKVKWAAVTAMGEVVAKIADDDMEAARVIMRRLMWNLNDESGGIGWGSPEAMGEILACHEGLAQEYANILLSYAWKDGNYLEHKTLQRGLLWGIGRLSQVRPHLIKDSVQLLTPFLDSDDITLRALTAWVMCLTDSLPLEARAKLESLEQDDSKIRIYVDRRQETFLLKDLASQALRKHF